MFAQTGKKESVSSNHLEIIESSLKVNGFEGLERNMVWSLEESTGTMVQPDPRDANHSNRSTAPLRSALKPRVDAAFQKYMFVVNAAKSRVLQDWRKLHKSIWEDRKNDNSGKLSVNQSATDVEQEKADADVEFNFERPIAEYPTMVLPTRNSTFAHHNNSSGRGLTQQLAFFDQTPMPRKLQPATVAQQFQTKIHTSELRTPQLYT
jgi:hypothetical protein